MRAAVVIVAATPARADLDAEAAAVTAALPGCAPDRAHSNRHFAALDLGFTVVGIDTLPAEVAHVATRRDRDRLAAGRLVGPVIHVFVVGHVVLSTVAPARVLAHELGHVLGLPHSTYPISIMNKAERAEPPVEQRTFADEELAAMRPVLGRLLRDKVIAEVVK